MEVIMKFASEDLIAEHVGIKRALAILENMLRILGTNHHVDVDDIKDIIHFFSVFADRCHHGKEENFLFPELRDARQGGMNPLITELLTEHGDLRTNLSAMSKSFQINTFDTRIFRQAAEAYTLTVTPHIDKENNILFPYADSHLSQEKQDELRDKFDEFENTVMGENTHKELHLLLERLEAKYNAGA